MVTGDFMITAVAIAKQVCLYLRHSRRYTYYMPLQVGIISQGRYDTINNLARSETSSDVEKKSEETKETKLSIRAAADMKPTDDDPIRALILTGDDLEKLNGADWNMILAEYTEIVFARTTLEQKMLIVEETKKRGDNIVAVVSF
jgi:sodium/potassium-transporting ATPase subunit alpha